MPVLNLAVLTFILTLFIAVVIALALGHVVHLGDIGPCLGGCSDGISN